MADEVEIEGRVSLTVDADNLDAEVANVLRRELSQLAKQLGKDFSNLGRQLDRAVKPGFQRVVNDAQDARRALGGVGTGIEAVRRSARALENSFGDAFDPGNVAAYEDILQRLLVVTAKLGEGGLNEQEFQEATQEARALTTAVGSACRG